MEPPGKRGLVTFWDVQAGFVPNLPCGRRRRGFGSTPRGVARPCCSAPRRAPSPRSAQASSSLPGRCTLSAARTGGGSPGRSWRPPGRGRVRGGVASMSADAPTIVLVHGGWADATGFDGVIPGCTSVGLSRSGGQPAPAPDRRRRLGRGFPARPVGAGRAGGPFRWRRRCSPRATRSSPPTLHGNPRSQLVSSVVRPGGHSEKNACRRAYVASGASSGR
jgi:hypothetical protein